jgi:hypothetical protein
VETSLAALFVFNVVYCNFIVDRHDALDCAGSQDEFKPGAQNCRKVNHGWAWLGDFDKMAAKRQMRVSAVNSRTFYFLNRGRLRGISYDLLLLLYSCTRRIFYK